MKEWFVIHIYGIKIETNHLSFLSCNLFKSQMNGLWDIKPESRWLWQIPVVHLWYDIFMIPVIGLNINNTGFISWKSVLAWNMELSRRILSFHPHLFCRYHLCYNFSGATIVFVAADLGLNFVIHFCNRSDFSFFCHGHELNSMITAPGLQEDPLTHLIVYFPFIIMVINPSHLL